MGSPFMHSMVLYKSIVLTTMFRFSNDDGHVLASIVVAGVVVAGVLSTSLLHSAAYLHTHIKMANNRATIKIIRPVFIDLEDSFESSSSKCSLSS
jgi:hypothetical protein